MLNEFENLSIFFFLRARIFSVIYCMFIMERHRHYCTHCIDVENNGVNLLVFEFFSLFSYCVIILKWFSVRYYEYIQRIVV